MKNRSKSLAIIIFSLCIGAVLLLSAIAICNAERKSAEQILVGQMLATADLEDALARLEAAIEEDDPCGINREAGRAEAYLSRCGIADLGEIYALIDGICDGRYGMEICSRLRVAVHSALEGDGGAALRALGKPHETQERTEETTEELWYARMLEKLGKGRGDIVEKHAADFACPNAVFKKCGSDKPETEIFSGENIFIALAGSNARVTMYCFDRPLDSRYSITPEQAAHTVEMTAEREKLSLPQKVTMDLRDGIYRFAYKAEAGAEPLVVFEVYSDTGRLRMFNASNYYK